MNQEKKPGPLERGADTLKRLHYAIGTAALVGFAAEVATGIAIINPSVLGALALIEFAHGPFINGIKGIFKSRAKPKPAPA